MTSWQHHWLSVRWIHPWQVGISKEPAMRRCGVSLAVSFNKMLNKPSYCRWCELQRRSMMTSSNGNIFRVTDHLGGEVTGEFPAQRPVTRSFDVFFDLRLNKRLSKQKWGWWFETLSRPLWRHCNALILRHCKVTFLRFLLLLSSSSSSWSWSSSSSSSLFIIVPRVWQCLTSH